MSAHARLSPSNHRWPNCPGSVREEAKYPDAPNDGAAIDGTGSHVLLEMCLVNSVPAVRYEQETIGVGHEDQPMGWYVDKDRCARVQMCLDYIERRVKELKAEGYSVTVLSESPSNPGETVGRTDWYGTADVTLIARVDGGTVPKSDGGTAPKFNEGTVALVEVIDYKDGRLWVDARDNTQLLSYLLGRKSLLQPPGRARATLVQPKTSPVIRYQDLSGEELSYWREELRKAAGRTDAPDAPLVPDGKAGKGWCRWCRHRDHCEALANSLTGEVTKMEDLTSLAEMGSVLENITSAPGEKLAELLDTRKAVEEIYDRIAVEIQSRLEAGASVPGYAMRPGNGSRRWARSEEEIVKVLKGLRVPKSEIYPAKLISPAQALKLEKLTQKQRDRLSGDYIEFVSGPPKLTPVSKESAPPEDMFASVAPPAATELPSFL